jgi:hypothetical protein
MPWIPILIRAHQLTSDSDERLVQETATESLRTLLQNVADSKFTVEEALDYIDFGPEEGVAATDPVHSQNEQPLRFRFACDRDAMRIVLMMVRDKNTLIEKALSCFIFSGETRAMPRGA